MIDTNRLLSLFEKLMSFDSPSFEERQFGDFVTQQLQNLSIFVWEDGAAEAIGGNCGSLHAYLEGTLDLPPLLGVGTISGNMHCMDDCVPLPGSMRSAIFLNGRTSLRR